MSGRNKTSNAASSSSSKDPETISWATESLSEWGETAKSNCVIYTYGFATFLTLREGDNENGENENDSDSDNNKYRNKKGHKKSHKKLDNLAGSILLCILLMVAIVIQTVIPISIVFTMGIPEGGICPNRATGLIKFIGLTLCLFFVVLTISMCLSKMRAMCFLRLFCGHHDAPSSSCIALGRLCLDAGIIANMVSMAAAGAAQYLLFVRNANRDVLLLLLQSLAMQFVLTADQKLMTSAWAGATRNTIELLFAREERDQAKKNSNPRGDAEEGGGGRTEQERQGTPAVRGIGEENLAKVRLMNRAETMFLVMVVVVGGAWSVVLTCCM
mmetsp:Transcript_2460/g.5858  ORF Transcript_2460/g.5858 Transcript_2460/m.5858 type:complete len:329 (-) Transcript_2460:328-1314(-)